jgi:NTP pyrophosphatase (non-canonical NTP hydrolase)
MKTRIGVNQDTIDKVFNFSKEHLKTRIIKHGSDSFISPHEILGILEEEIHELVDAVRENNNYHIVDELHDTITVCIFGIASLLTNEDWSDLK